MIEIPVLFWNTGRSRRMDVLQRLIRETPPAVLILAESLLSSVQTLELINQAPFSRFHLPPNQSTDLQFFASGPPERFHSLFDGPSVAVRRFRPIIGGEVLIVAVHFPSKLHISNEGQAQLCTRLSRIVRESEAKVGHQRTLLIGDLNMNPFEQGVVGSEGLHAVMSRRIAQKRQRRVLHEDRSFFYNPMWSLMGDASTGPPGSYYYHASEPISYFWNTFDQVLLRPDLAAYFNPGDVAVVDRVGEFSLVTPSGKPIRAISDHLPLRAVVRVEEFENVA